MGYSAKEDKQGGLLNEFKDFAMKGDVHNMAIGVMKGRAFGKIVFSLISDVLILPIGLLTGGVDGSSVSLNLIETPQGSLSAARAAGEPTAHDVAPSSSPVLFLLVKQMNRFEKEARPARVDSHDVDA